MELNMTKGMMQKRQNIAKALFQYTINKMGVGRRSWELENTIITQMGNKLPDGKMQINSSSRSSKRKNFRILFTLGKYKAFTFDLKTTNFIEFVIFIHHSNYNNFIANFPQFE
jgi:hypothetical protein